MVLVWLLCLPWVLSTAKTCDYSQSPSNMSAALDSLRCYNDYKSHFHCTWRAEPDRPLTLMFYKKNRRRGSQECKDQAAAEGTRACRYEAKVFTRASEYTAYFKDPTTTHHVCFSIKPSLQDLPLRAHTPLNLSTSSTGHGDTLVTWCSPYPQSSALNDDITYQLLYRQQGHIDWTSMELRDTRVVLDRSRLLPGRLYEARVSARVGQGHWSLWSPTVSWQTQLDPEHAPHVDCVLWGEGEAHCSWEQSKEQSHFITYQLFCHHHDKTTPQECCNGTKVSPGHSEDTVKFRCRLTLTNSSTLTLRMELVPKRSSKLFNSMQHVRPPPPTDVNVTLKGSNLVVEWIPAVIEKEENLRHEVRYYSQENKEDARSIHSDLSFVNIPRSRLPAHRCWVQVRSLVKPPFEGVPSEWSPPKDCTLQEDSEVSDAWKYYVSVAVVIVGAVIVIIVFIVSVCKRRVVLWMDTIPSPGRSKVILNIQSVKNLEVMSCETTYLSKVVDMGSVSTCSTLGSPWLKQGLHSQTEEVEDEGVWSDDNLPTSPLSQTPMSFSGPYILFQPMKLQISEQTERIESSGPVMGRPVLVMSPLSDQDYVPLPGLSLSPHTQALSSLNHGQNDQVDNMNTEEEAEEEQRPHSNEYVSETFWPQEGDIEVSGYCQLPAEITLPEPD